MARHPIRLTIEKNLLDEIDKISTSLSVDYKVSKSDLYNEALSYGIPIIKMRHKLGNEKIDEIFNLLSKAKEEQNNGREQS